MLRYGRIGKALAFVGACAALALWSAQPWAVVPTADDSGVPPVDNDFNGDGKADMLWRNADNGNTVIWLMDGTTILGTGSLGVIDLAWIILRVEDYNGDGKADITFRNAEGSIVIWLMDGLEPIEKRLVAVPPPVWLVQ